MTESKRLNKMGKVKDKFKRRKDEIGQTCYELISRRMERMRVRAQKRVSLEISGFEFVDFLQGGL